MVTQQEAANGFGAALKKYSDALLGFGVLGLMVTLIMPMPPVMLDLLLALDPRFDRLAHPRRRLDVAHEDVDDVDP